MRAFNSGRDNCLSSEYRFIQSLLTSMIYPTSTFFASIQAINNLNHISNTHYVSYKLFNKKAIEAEHKRSNDQLRRSTYYAIYEIRFHKCSTQASNTWMGIGACNLEGSIIRLSEWRDRVPGSNMDIMSFLSLSVLNI